MLFAAPLVHASNIVVSSPFAGEAGDGLSRGFYILNYAGTNLGTVTLGYVSFTPGSYSTSLTARLGTYDGSLLGTATSSNTLNTTETLVTFDFGGVAVPTGSTITFKQAIVSGPGSVFYDTGTTATDNVRETNGTAAPLDTFRRNQVGIIVTQAAGAATPEPSTLLLFLPALAGMLILRKQKA